MQRHTWCSTALDTSFLADPSFATYMRASQARFPQECKLGVKQNVLAAPYILSRLQ